MRVNFDSDVANEFIVTTKEGRTIRFPVDDRGLYVKESYSQIKKREEEEESVQEETNLPIISMDIDCED